MALYEDFDSKKYISNENSRSNPAINEIRKTTNSKPQKTPRIDADFIIHLRVFIIIIGSLLVIDLLTGGGLWFHYPAICWGIGLSCHFFASYIEDLDIDEERQGLLMHGAVTGTLVVFFILMDFFTSRRLNWWFYPSIAMIISWLIHRATFVNQNNTDNLENLTGKQEKRSSEKGKSNYCANCGQQLNLNAQFCQYCGKERT